MVDILDLGVGGRFEGTTWYLEARVLGGQKEYDVAFYVPEVGEEAYEAVVRIYTGADSHVAMHDKTHHVPPEETRKVTRPSMTLNQR